MTPAALRATAIASFRALLAEQYPIEGNAHG